MKDQINELNVEMDKLKITLSESEKKCYNMELERNTERNKCVNLNHELINTLVLHEKEVVMRLKFEAKINEIQATYRALENQFLVVNKELFVVSERLSSVFIDLTN